ncbi:SRPBCC domain-containing protein [Chitinophaga sp. 212800010-3]|jgi:uncharacterized protein YndB with AHSA1/START domain|uniref:SRPBCC domain-containing protein n=1 Tax=unclassified Chitinophaga TaxID=2619133 RepID=UPI002DF1F2B1|nr:ATPase [Chitinophaga sp. 212800010-3]
MELKTKVNAEDGKLEVVITREFELPVELLFRAHVEAGIIEQWMGTKVLKLEAQRHGSYQFETTDHKGNKYPFSGVIHDFIPDKKIVRTFEMETANTGVQLEFYEFEALTDDTSKLSMHVLYDSLEHRDQILKMGMPMGINMAHNRIQEVAGKLK